MRNVFAWAACLVHYAVPKEFFLGMNKRRGIKGTIFASCCFPEFEFCSLFFLAHLGAAVAAHTITYQWQHSGKEAVLGWLVSGRVFRPLEQHCLVQGSFMFIFLFNFSERSKYSESNVIEMNFFLIVTVLLRWMCWYLTSLEPGWLDMQSGTALLTKSCCFQILFIYCGLFVEQFNLDSGVSRDFLYWSCTV